MSPFDRIKKIIIHCSDSVYGDRDEIDAWHKARGWKGIGYHYVITNGRFRPMDKYREDRDGLIQFGRPLSEVGAHCKGHNKDSVGVCLIGKHHFSGRQLYQALPAMLANFMNLPGITGPECIFGHHEFNPNKTCPNIDSRDLRYLSHIAGLDPPTYRFSFRGQTEK